MSRSTFTAAELRAYADRQEREARAARLRRGALLGALGAGSVAFVLALVWAVVRVARLAWGSP